MVDSSTNHLNEKIEFDIEIALKNGVKRKNWKYNPPEGNCVQTWTNGPDHIVIKGIDCIEMTGRNCDECGVEYDPEWFYVHDGDYTTVCGFDNLVDALSYVFE